MADIKNKSILISNFMTFAHIYFKLPVSRVAILVTCIDLKIYSQKYQTGNTLVQIFEMVTKSKCYYFELANSFILSKFHLNHRFQGD